MIKEFSVKGYRSLQDITIPLKKLNVITGPNGSGKSNIYNALYLLAKSAEGNLAKTLAIEGGMPSILWAGNRKANSSKPVRVILSVKTESFSYEIALGLPSSGSPHTVPSLFMLDPQVKEEFIWNGRERRKATTYLERKTGTTWVMNDQGQTVCYPIMLSQSESVLSQLNEPNLYPELFSLREMMRGWRFYHNFRTDIESPVRLPQIGVRTTVLDHSGIDLAAALQTIIEIGDETAIRTAIDHAFPGSELIIKSENARLEIFLLQKGMKRPFSIRELSDGTVRYLCLMAALLSPRPSAFLALNEPETNLHSDLLEPLAELIYGASRFSQMWVTTHSKKMASYLSNLSGEAPIMLDKSSGFTELAS